MKIKNRLFIFLGIFIFMIIPKNVFAKEIFPTEAIVNNTTIVSNAVPNGSVYSSTIPANGTLSVNINVSILESFGTLADYPYAVVYFQSGLGPDNLSVGRNATCNYACFNQYGFILKNIGEDPVNNRWRYVLILPILKYDILGQTNSSYYVQDVITFSSNISNNRGFIISNIILADNDSVTGYYTTDFNQVITNATNNTNNIINNQNTNQAQTNQKLDDVKSATEDVNDTMKDETPVSDSDVSSKTNEWNNKLASTGPVSQIILLPITLLNGYVAGWNSSCSSFNLGNFFGTDIVFPCINLQNYFGSTLWGVLDALLSGFMILAIGKKFVKIFNDFTNLRDNQMDELYGGGK